MDPMLLDLGGKDTMANGSTGHAGGLAPTTKGAEFQELMEWSNNLLGESFWPTIPVSGGSVGKANALETKDSGKKEEEGVTHGVTNEGFTSETSFIRFSISLEDDPTQVLTPESPVSLGSKTSQDKDGRNSPDKPGRSSRPRLSTMSRLRGRGSEEELLYRLKMAHLSPRTDWYSEIMDVSEEVGDHHICGVVLDSLREFPLKMKQKLRLSRKLHQDLDGRPRLRSLSSRREMQRVMRRDLRNVSRLSLVLPSTFDLWGSSIAEISAYFGTHVASYFQLFRFVFLLNLTLGTVMFLFTSLPQMLIGETYDSSLQRGFFGDFSRTIFFYGAYSNLTRTYETMGVVWTYNHPLAYLATWFLVSLFGLAVIVSSMFLKYRKVKRTDSKHDDPYSDLTLLAWDYSVTNSQGSDLRRRTICTLIKEIIREETNQSRLLFNSKLKLYSMRLLCNLLSLLVLAVSIYTIVVVGDQWLSYSSGLPKLWVDLINDYKLSLTVAGMKMIVPPLLNLLLTLEKYQPRTTVKLEIARTAFYYVASLVVFCISIYYTAESCIDRDKLAASTQVIYTNTSTTTDASNINNNNTVTVSYSNTDNEGYYSNTTTASYINITIADNNRGTGYGVASGNSTVVETAPAPTCCWENQVGEQLLQLVLLDMFLALLVRSRDALRYVITKHCKYINLGYSIPLVSRLVLDLVYSQCLVWLGLFAMPALTLVSAARLIVLFYVTRSVALKCCLPPSNLFRASRSGSFYLFVLAAALSACMGVLGLTVVRLKPSVVCGPFKYRDTAYDVILNLIGSSPSWFQDFLVFLTTPGIVFPVFLALLFLVLYYRTKSATHKGETRDLRHYLQFEKKVEKREILARAQLQRGFSVATHLSEMA